MNAAPCFRIEQDWAAGKLGWFFIATSTVIEPTPQTDLELLRRIAQGDSAALGQFYDLHSGPMFALACHILNDGKEAEDVLQEVFLQLWQKAAVFDSTLGRPL